MVQKIFREEMKQRDLKGTISIAKFSDVFRRLMPVQQNKLKELSSLWFNELIEHGSFISLAFAYSQFTIEAIGIKKDDEYDKKAWNIYAREYKKIE